MRGLGEIPSLQGTKNNVKPLVLFVIIMEENKVAVETPEVEAVKETKKAPLNASVAPENFDWEAFEKEAAYGRHRQGFYRGRL